METTIIQNLENKEVETMKKKELELKSCKLDLNTGIVSCDLPKEDIKKVLSADVDLTLRLSEKKDGNKK